MHKLKEHFRQMQPNISDFSNKTSEAEPRLSFFLCGDLFTPGLEDANCLHCAACNSNAGALSGQHPRRCKLLTVDLPGVTALHVIRRARTV